MTTIRDELLDLIVRWEDAKAQGQDLSPDQLCEDCPALLDEFRRHLDTLRAVSWLNDPIEAVTTGSAEQPAADLGEVPLPRMIAERYRLDALIGEGGFGRVYRGFDTWLERAVAVKIPRVDHAVTGTEVDLCRLEARKAARLRHPGIVPVHDVGRDGATCFIVSEWIDGENLASRLKKGRVPVDEAARIIAEVAEALDDAHRQGFVHRDVKPANILIDAQGRTYLTDFGITVLADELLSHPDTAGTLPYMAPEQLSDGFGPVDHRADVFALGVVFYELLTGLRPFRAVSPVELRQQILQLEPLRPHSIDATIPPELERVCLRCLAKDSDQRYQHAALVASAIRGM
jgi:serine/threonine protein kinase